MVKAFPFSLPFYFTGGGGNRGTLLLLGRFFSGKGASFSRRKILPLPPSFLGTPTASDLTFLS